MSHFKTEKFKIEGESKEAGAIRVMKLETGSGPQVKSFSLPELEVRGKGDYGAIKNKYGALAATDEDRHSKSSRDSRFSVNPLLRGSLAIEEEERRVIDRRVQDNVRAVAEQARVEGEKRGYEAGLKKGRDEAYEEFGKEAASSLESLRTFVQSFESMKSDVFKANERFLVDLVFRVSRMLVLKELSADPDYVLRLSRELVDRVGIRDNVKIRINPKDASSIEALKADLTQTFSDLKNLSVEVSDDVQDGGCQIETQWSAIDASIDTQLKGIQEALTEAALSSKPPVDPTPAAPAAGSPKSES